jgi:hypothetical protein
MGVKTVVVAALGIGLGSLSADAQVIGTFPWQTQPYCNRIVLTVVQQGGVYQLVGTDDQCGAGSAPVTGTAVPTGSGVAMGVTIALASGRVAHLTASISLATLSGTWTDADGHTGAFVFSGATGGALRPAPAGATAIVVTQFSPTVYGGTGTAATVARSDHTHDDRYYTRAQVDAGSKWISVDPLAVAHRNGASVQTGFGINAGLWLPGGPADLPAFEFGFAMPPDYTAGTDVAVQLLWHINQTGCTVNLSSNYASIDHYGAVPTGTSFGFRVTDPVPSTANEVARSTFTVRSALLAAGDSVIVGLFRSYNSDTCVEPLQIKGIRVLYN